MIKENIIDLYEDIVIRCNVMVDDDMKPARLYINTNNYNLIAAWANDTAYQGMELIHNYHLPINRFFILSDDEVILKDAVQLLMEGDFDKVEITEDVQLNKLAITVHHMGVSLTIGVPFHDLPSKKKELEVFITIVKADLLASIRKENSKYPYLNQLKK